MQMKDDRLTIQHPIFIFRISSTISSMGAHRMHDATPQITDSCNCTFPFACQRSEILLRSRFQRPARPSSRFRSPPTASLLQNPRGSFPPNHDGR